LIVTIFWRKVSWEEVTAGYQRVEDNQAVGFSDIATIEEDIPLD
jgi:hypothetical protein